jgi:hypothetical protein
MSDLLRRRNIERRAHLKTYGLTPELFEEYKLRQRGVCAICGNSLEDPAVKAVPDHIHDATRKVRGILCNHCNLMIGHAFENPAILRSGAEYLEAHGHV